MPIVPPPTSPAEPPCSHANRFTRFDFSPAERKARNPLYVAVKNGRYICKGCGKEFNTAGHWPK